jgi:hypothetical protein
MSWTLRVSATEAGFNCYVKCLMHLHPCRSPSLNRDGCSLHLQELFPSAVHAKLRLQLKRKRKRDHITILSTPLSGNDLHSVRTSTMSRRVVSQLGLLPFGRLIVHLIGQTAINLEDPRVRTKTYLLNAKMWRWKST